MNVVCPMCSADFSAPSGFAEDGATCPACGVEILASAMTVGTEPDQESATGVSEQFALDVPAPDLLVPVYEDEPKKQFAHNPKLAITIVAVAVTASLIGVLAAVLIGRMDRPMRYMPDDMVVMLSLRYANINDCEFTEVVKRELPYTKEGQSFRDTLFSQMGGFDRVMLDHVDRAWIGLAVDGNTAIYVKFKESIAAAQIVDWFKPDSFKESEAGSSILYRSDTMAFCVVNSKSVVFGSRDGLNKIVNRGRSPKLSDEMKDALAHADMSKSGCLVGNVGGRVLRRAGVADQLAGAGQLIKNVRYFVLSTDVDEQVTIDATIACDDAKSAAALESFLNQQLQTFRQLVVVLLKEEAADDVFDAIETSVVEAEVRLTATIDEEGAVEIGRLFRDRSEALP